MRISFNPPVKPFANKLELEIILCPKCKSDRVYAHVLVHGMAYVNANTLIVDEPPEESDCSVSDVRDDGEYICFKCDHKWTEEEE